MKILIACEFSGIVRDAFKARGHDAWSCDLLPTEIPGNHIQGDVLKYLDDGWDMMIAHPPCTFLTVARNKYYKHAYNTRFPTQHQDREKAVAFFIKLIDANIGKIAIENPVGIMSTRLRKADQHIQPYQFGDAERKTTGLWLKNLSLLTPTNIVEPKLYTYKNGKTDGMWHVKTMQLRGEERMKVRSKTFQGIANAMADQWG